eukprot:s130_g1.t1
MALVGDVGPDAASGWRSDALATAIRVNLPPAVIALFDEPTYEGNGLLSLPESGAIRTPSASEISLNYTFLLPIVPSAFFLTDVFLRFDQQLQKKVFRPTKDPEMTRMSLAACEGVKAKRLIGSLRALWRSSKMKGHNQRVTHLKSFLRESPERQRPAPVVQDAPDPPAAVSDHEVSDEGPADDDGSSGESSPGSPNREAVVEVGANVESEHDAADSDSSSLKAPTLRLDDCRDDAEELGTESDSSESSDVDGEPCSPVYKDAFEAGDS